MVDYALDDTFDIFKTKYDDIAEVDGLEEFEQDLIVRLDTELDDYIGGFKNSETLKEKAELIATRLAREHDVLESVVKINVTDLPEKSQTLEIEIVYKSSRNFDEIL